MSLPKGLNENRSFCATKSLELAEDQLKWANWAGNAWDIFGSLGTWWKTAHLIEPYHHWMEDEAHHNHRVDEAGGHVVHEDLQYQEEADAIEPPIKVSKKRP
jgi:hypothetical protein